MSDLCPRCRTPLDIDEVAVDRAVAGDRTVPLNGQEVEAAFRRLNAAGLSASEIARVLGYTQRTVERWRTGTRRYWPTRRRPS